jgi:uncharacterized protein YcbK (DUF882 family)
MTIKPLHKRILIAFAATAVAAVIGIAPPEPVRAADARQLSFYHTHTRLNLDVVYYQNGEYVDSALDDINRFLKDFRTGEVTNIDPELLDLLHDLRNELDSDGPFEVISAYRSPKTNELLRSRSSGVAKNSQHLRGTAIDVRLRGTRTARLRDTAWGMQRGGVGYYEKSDFVHVDTGRVRRW